MEVGKTRGIKGPEAPKTEPVKGRAQGAGEGIPARSDEVTLSGGARDVARLSAAAQELPDVRSEKVEALQNALESGTYAVQGSAVAEKLLREVLIDTTVR